MDSQELIRLISTLLSILIIIVSTVSCYYMAKNSNNRIREIYLKSFLERYPSQKIYLGFDNHRLCYFNPEGTLCGSKWEWEDLYKRPVNLEPSFDKYHAGLCKISLCKKYK